MQQLAGKCGAAVALDPRTGAVLAMASRPTYNPNLVESNFSKILRVRAPCAPASPLVNRATAGLFTPGSSFKVVTSTAALDSGRYNINSAFFDKGYCVEYGQQVHNFADQGRVEQFGSVNFLQALENSINAVFCEIGQQIGERSILNAAKRFGFYKPPPLETPDSERNPSGLYDQHNQLFDPTSPSQVDVGRLAFGQGPGTAHPLVTPLQMAMVAAGVANQGVVMRPFVLQNQTGAGGTTAAPIAKLIMQALLASGSNP